MTRKPKSTSPSQAARSFPASPSPEKGDIVCYGQMSGTSAAAGGRTAGRHHQPPQTLHGSVADSGSFVLLARHTSSHQRRVLRLSRQHLTSRLPCA
jgi:hypothetical protein